MMFYDVLCLKSILGFLLSERTSGVSPAIFPLAVLFFGLCTAVLTFGQCMHKVSTASVDSIVVICIISTDIIIFGVSNEHYLRPVDKCFIQYMCMFYEITK